MATTASAEIIETNSFSYTLPSSWKANLKSKPLSASGPNGELLQLSVSSVTKAGNPKEAGELLREIEGNAATSMTQTAADPQLVTTMPLKRSKLKSGFTLQEMASKTKDGQVVFAQFAITGPRSVLFATLECPASKGMAAISAIRESLTQIQWRP